MKLLLIILLIFYYLFNDHIQIGQDNKVCIIDNSNIRCSFNDQLIFEKTLNLPLNFRNVRMGNNKICYFNYNIDKDYIFKAKLNCYNIEIKEELKMEDIDFIVDPLKPQIGISDDLVCAINRNDHLSCYGTPEALSTVPSEFTKPNSYLNIRSLVSGPNNICVIFDQILQTSTIECFGSNETHINEIPSSIININMNTNLGSISVGRDTACAFFTEDQQFNSICWGMCRSKMCQIPKDNLSYIQDISVGDDHVCSISNFKLNQNSQLSSSQSNPTININLTDSFSNSFSIQHGKLTCWGGNEQGQSTIPARYQFYIIEVKLGAMMTCVIKANYQHQCFGRQNYSFPYLNNQFYSISTGGRHVCGVKAGKQECWGGNDFGQIDLDGVSNTFDYSYDISAGWDYTCQFNADSKIDCLGFNQLGQTDLPEEVSNMSQNEVKISAGLDHTCATLKKDVIPLLICWGGRNIYGQNDPVSISQGDFISYHQLVSVGHDFTCTYVSALMDNNDQRNSVQIIQCFGNNEQSQLDVYNIQQNKVMVNFISSGGAHSCIRYLSTPNVACWGSNLYGQILLPEDVDSSLVSTGDTYTCIIKNRVEIQCFGMNQFDKVQMKVRINFISTDFENLCYINQNRIAKCIGDNEQGQCQIPSQKLIQSS